MLTDTLKGVSRFQDPRDQSPCIDIERCIRAERWEGRVSTGTRLKGVS